MNDHNLILYNPLSIKLNYIHILAWSRKGQSTGRSQGEVVALGSNFGRSQGEVVALGQITRVIFYRTEPINQYIVRTFGIQTEATLLFTIQGQKDRNRATRWS